MQTYDPRERRKSITEDNSPWDWQTCALVLAVCACIAFFLVAGCSALVYARQWRRMKRNFEPGKRKFEENEYNITYNNWRKPLSKELEISVLRIFGLSKESFVRRILMNTNFYGNSHISSIFNGFNFSIIFNRAPGHFLSCHVIHVIRIITVDR